MIEKSYSLELRKKLHLFNQELSVSYDSCIGIKTSETNGLSIKIIDQSDAIAARHYIINTTTVEANYSNMVATDMVGHYKTFRPSGIVAAYIDEIEAEMDSNFIYSDKQFSVVQMTTTLGDSIYREYEFVPVFVDARMSNLKKYIDIDGKSFTVSVKNGKAKIVFSKPFTKVMDVYKNIFDIKASHYKLRTDVEVDDFIYSESKKINGTNKIVEYDYISRVNNTHKDILLAIDVGTDKTVHIGNNNIDLYDCKIIEIDGSAVAEIDASSALIQSVGKLDLSLIPETISATSIVLKYSYLSIPKASLSISHKDIDYNTSIQIYCMPTKVGLVKNNKTIYHSVYNNDMVVATDIQDIQVGYSASGALFEVDYSDLTTMYSSSQVAIRGFYDNQQPYVDSYMNGIHAKSLGIIAIRNGPAETYESAGMISKILSTHHDFDTVKEYSGAVCNINNTKDIICSAGILIINTSSLPYTFSVETITPSEIVVKINTTQYATYTNAFETTNQTVIDLFNENNSLAEDWTIDLEKYTIHTSTNNVITEATYISKAITIDNLELYIKVQNNGADTIHIGYNDYISPIGISI